MDCLLAREGNVNFFGPGKAETRDRASRRTHFHLIPIRIAYTEKLSGKLCQNYIKLSNWSLNNLAVPFILISAESTLKIAESNNCELLSGEVMYAHENIITERASIIWLIAARLSRFFLGFLSIADCGWLVRDRVCWKFIVFQLSERLESDQVLPPWFLLVFQVHTGSAKSGEGEKSPRDLTENSRELV